MYTQIYIHTYVYTYIYVYVYTRICTYIYVYVKERTKNIKNQRKTDIHESKEKDSSTWSFQQSYYGVAVVSRIDKIIGLFCKRAL